MNQEKLKKELKLCFALILIVVIGYFLFFQGGITGAVAGIQEAEIEEKVLEELGEKEEVSVIVMLEEDGSSIKERQERVLGGLNLEEKEGFLGILNEEKEFELGHKYSTVNAFSGEVTEKGLEKLKKDPKVKKVFFNEVLRITLDTSVPQINADDVWSLSVNGIDIKGSGETVCVIDTGIDTDHSAFTGRILDQYCYCRATDYGSGGCCSDNTAEDDNAEDVHGHGTHCAGIAAGNHGAYKGVAPAAGIIAIKVCDDSGICNTDDVISAIDWCVNNASKYNVSVISLSLGEFGPYNTYCDDDSFGIAPAINSAVAENISVVIAAGNNGWTNGTSVPACVENATPVGAVDSADSITYNRGNILELLAPGVSITAPYKGGGTATFWGTSASTPHVAGAIALLQQFNKLQKNQVLTPQGIENILNSTGKAIDDSSGSGKNYSRIDIYAAIISIDDVAPTINFVAPTSENGSIKVDYQVIINTTSSETLQNAVLEWNGINETMDGSGINFYKIKDNSINGNHTFRVYGTDFANNTNVTGLRIFTLNNSLNITYNFPLNDSYHSSAFNLDVTIINCNNLSTSFYNITNSSGDVIQENSNLSIESFSFSWDDLVNVSDANFVDGSYKLNVFANDSLGNFDVKEVNFIVDKTEPDLFGFDKSPLVVYSDDAVIFYVNVSDENRDEVLIEGDWTEEFVNYTMVLESGDRFSYSVSSGNLSNQEKVGYRFYAFDLVGNTGSSSLFNFTVQNRVPIVNITNPADGTVVEVGSSVQFNSTATDPDGDSLSYAWDFGGGAGSGQNLIHQFDSTGDFAVVLNVSDGYGFSLTNISVVVNDTQLPEMQSIDYDDGIYEGTNQNVTTSIFDYSGIFNVTLYFDGGVKDGSCTESGDSWDCSWSWETSSYGDYSFIIEATDNFSVKHSVNWTYDFSVIGCGDERLNGDEDCDGDNLGGETCVSQGYDDGILACSGSCTFDTNNCSSENNESGGSDSGGDAGDSGGGGGSGGGSSGSTVTTAAEEPVVEELEESVEEAVEELEETTSFASPDSNLVAGESVEEEEVEGKMSLTGMAVNFLKEINEWSLETKVLLGVVFFVIVLLVLYFVLREKE